MSKFCYEVQYWYVSDFKEVACGINVHVTFLCILDIGYLDIHSTARILSFVQIINTQKRLPTSLEGKRRTLLGMLVVLLGCLLLVHAAYSAHQCKSCCITSFLSVLLTFSTNFATIVKVVNSISDFPLDGVPPWDIHAELLTSISLILFGVIARLKLSPIQQSSMVEMHGWDEYMGRTDFSTFNHRK